MNDELENTSTTGAQSGASSQFSAFGFLANTLTKADPGQLKGFKAANDFHLTNKNGEAIISGQATVEKVRAEQGVLAAKPKKDREEALEMLRKLWEELLTSGGEADTATVQFLSGEKTYWDDLWNKSQVFDDSLALAELSVVSRAMSRTSTVRKPGMPFGDWMNAYRTVLSVSCVPVIGSQSARDWIALYDQHAAQGSYARATRHLSAAAKTSDDMIKVMSTIKNLDKQLKEVHKRQDEQEDRKMSVAESNPTAEAPTAGGKKKQ
jgi:hypothetical protein